MAKKRKRKTAGKTLRGGRPFAKGFDPRRNLDGPDPDTFAIKRALKRDGLHYIDHLYKESAKLQNPATRFALEQILGKAPASIVLSGPDGKPLQLEVTQLSELSDDELATVKAARAILDRLEQRKPPADGGDRSGAAPASVQAEPSAK